MAKYLDKSGVTYLWNKIKGLFTDQSLNTKNKTYAGAINEINTKVGNLTGALIWKGKFDTLPAVTDYEAGNVVGVGNKEYVLTVTGSTKAWEELGDVGSYLLKSVAEETYLKKAAGEVKTANLADNAVTSTKLAIGARKPIIITGDMTEVDEETYQKLLSNNVDVMFNMDGGPLYLNFKELSDNGINLLFGYILTQPVSAEFPYGCSIIAQIVVTISSATPHKLVLSEPTSVAYNPDDFILKDTLSPVLQEIDLTGTDAERKAKLDQFETDWMALTGASDILGARFVGDIGTPTGELSTIFAWNSTSSFYEGAGTDDVGKIYKIQVDPSNGSITITPLFSHLEAITIYTDNTPEHMQANLDNIAAYEANLQALGVDTTKGWNAPVKVNAINGISLGIFASDGENTNTPHTIISGLAGEYPYIIRINKTSGASTMWEILCDGRNYARITTTAKSIISAINEINANAVHSDKLVPTLEAITIKTGNTPDDKAANVAAIKAYVDNLTALGVDVTKGYIIPITDGTYQGILMSLDGHRKRYRGQLYKDDEHYCPIYIEEDGAIHVSDIFISYTANLSTTSKQIVGAINEVNALAKGKQDKLTSGTNIKTVNGQSLLGSGNIAISGGGGDVTKAGNNIFTGNNTFTTFVHFSRGIEITNANEDMHYYLDLDSNTNKFRISNDSDMDVEVTGVDTPTQDNAAANKKYVDDKVAAGGGSAPVLVDIDDISGSAGDSVPVDVFNKIANAASAKTPIFGYTNSSIGRPVSNYEIIPLTVKYLSNATVAKVMIDFIFFNKHYSINLSKNADNTYTVENRNTHSLADDTSVSNSSTNGIQSRAVWKEIHSEPMTVNTATSGVTTLSSTDKHKILCYADSGTQQYNLPSSPVDGETFLFLKVKSGHTITIQSGTGNENIYDCSSGSSVVSKTIATSTKRKITATYSSTVGKWFLMADDFLS